MRVLFLTRLYWPHIGGVEKHVEEVSKILSQKHEITIVTEQYDPKLSQFQTRDGVTIYRIPLLSRGEESVKKWLIWKWFVTHLNLINQAEVIHIHDVFYWFLPFRLPYFWKKAYITFHGYEGHLPTATEVLWHRLAAALTRGHICIGGFHPKWYHVSPTFVSYGAVA